MKEKNLYILIGYKGLIGKNILKQLRLKNKLVKIFDLPTFDLKSKSSIKRAFFKNITKNTNCILINCSGLMDAKISRENPELFYKINGIYVQRLIDIFSNAKSLSFIQLSSETVYGKGINFVENDRRMPIHPYGNSKKISEDILIQIKENNVNIVILRIPIVVGINSSTGNMLTDFIKEAKNKSEITIFGDGKHKRKFIYQDDLTSIIVKISLNWRKFKKYEVFNIPGFICSASELARKIKKQIKGDIKINYLSNKPNAFSLTSKSIKIMKSYNIKLKTNLNKMIKILVKSSL